jgi:predicted alpha/beta-fold hydrolase
MVIMVTIKEPFESKKHMMPELNLGLRSMYRTKLRENMILCISEKGGHHSFLEGVWPVYYSWLDKCLGEYLEAVHCLYESNEIKK